MFDNLHSVFYYFEENKNVTKHSLIHPKRGRLKNVCSEYILVTRNSMQKTNNLHQMKIFISIIFILVFIPSCTLERSDVVGIYVAKNLNNNIDTLRICENANYVRNIYRKSDRSLIYCNIGKWKHKNKRITLENFLPDEDEVHSQEEDFESILITSSLNINRRFNKIVIYYMQLTEYKYYEKQ